MESRNAQQVRALARAILATLEPATVVPFLAAMRVWFRALVTVALEGEKYITGAEDAECAASDIAPCSVFHALIAVLTYRSPNELTQLAATGQYGGRDDVLSEARDALDEIAKLIAEHEAAASPAPASAPSAQHDPVAAFVEELTAHAVFLDNGPIALAAAHARMRDCGASHTATTVVLAAQAVLQNEPSGNIHITETDAAVTITGFEKSAEYLRRLAPLLAHAADALDHLIAAGGIK